MDAKTRFREAMGSSQPIIGMVHVQALPGTSGYQGAIQPIIDAALRDAAILKHAGVDAILIENMHDLPYLNRQVGHEISTAMAVIGYLIKHAFQLPTGMQILAGANLAALAAAHASGLDFIRAEGFVFGHLADEGWMDADAGPLLRYRRQIGAERILILTDIRKKHSAHAATADLSLRDIAEAAAFFGSEGLIITGNATGKPADSEDLASLHNTTELPLIVGSGINIDNCLDYAATADGFIVGSSIKEGGDWRAPVDLDRCSALVKAIKATL